MYMLDLDRVINFQWDRGNIDKNFTKHNITPNESEEAFLDQNLKTYDDIEHSQKEKRYIAIGKSKSKNVLYIVFTIRNSQIRVISARIANTKERKIYEK